jgi:hypothetical protein
MTVAVGKRYSDTDTYNIGIDMSSTLSMLDASEAPLLTMVGKTSIPVTAVKHEWLEDELRPLDGTLDGSELDNTTAGVTAMVVATGQWKYLRTGDILQIGAEKLVVTATPTTTTVAITRHYAGTSSIAHATGAAWAIVGQAILQDAALGDSRTTIKAARFNYTQIYEDAIRTTSTQRSIKRWVEQNDTSAQVMRAMKTCWKTWNRTLWLGQLIAPTYAVPGLMDGVLPVITTNAYAKGGSVYLTEAMILQAMQDSWNVGGRIDTIFTGAFQKRQMNQFLDSMRMTTRTDRTAGVVVDTYTSDFGTANIVIDRDCPTDTVALFDINRIGFGPLTDHAMSVAPVETGTRSFDAVQFWGQYTSETRNQNAHAKITGLATS